MFTRLIIRSKSYFSDYHRVALFSAGSLFFLYRLFYLPGLEFNSKLWDDEVGWEREFQGRGSLEWLVYRDAPGYFVFFPRLVLLLCHWVPDSIFPLFLRMVLILLNLMSVYFAVKLLTGQDWKLSSSLLIFCCFCSIYISDLNYLHNISYYFIFPILFLMQKISQYSGRYTLVSLALIILLIGKPIVSILLIVLLAHLFLTNNFPKRPLWFLVIYNIFYLGSYFFLPNRWSTPTNSDFTTLKQLIVNIPWVFGMVLLPILYIGLNGFLHFLGLDSLRIILGISLYVIPSIAIVALWLNLRRKILPKANLQRLRISFLLLICSYLLVYLNSDSYWIKVFPLYKLNVPQDLWLRWSSLIPIFQLAVIWEVCKLLKRQRFAHLVLWSVMLQEFVFQVVAYSWLKRY